MRLPASNQRVHYREARKTTEVAVGRPEFAHRMFAAERRHARIMDLRAHNSTIPHERTQSLPVFCRLGQYREGGRF
jgi:hypothetical protein